MMPSASIRQTIILVFVSMICHTQHAAGEVLQNLPMQFAPQLKPSHIHLTGMESRLWRPN
jgi:hypothetical protein